VSDATLDAVAAADALFDALYTDDWTTAAAMADEAAIPAFRELQLSAAFAWAHVQGDVARFQGSDFMLTWSIADEWTHESNRCWASLSSRRWHWKPTRESSQAPTLDWMVQ
jgi:hypothetical protein